MSRRHILRVSILAGSCGVPRAHSAPEGGLLIRGGQLVSDARRWAADIRIREGRIVEIGPSLKPRGEARLVDASGLQVAPAGIDPHAHLLPPWVDDFESGSRGALAGGITSIGCMVSSQRGETFMDAIARESARVHAQSMCDIFLHPILSAPTDEARSLLSQLAESGHSDVKIFMTATGIEEELPKWTETIREAGRLGLISMLHCEDGRLMADARNSLVSKRKTSVMHYAASRPVAAELRAVERAVEVCRNSSAPVYIVHLSSEKALDVCRKARAEGLPVYVETRPIYLHFTSARYRAPDGPLYVGQPPLREESDVEALWKGLAAGDIDTVGSDHAPWTREQKMDSKLDITRLRPGVADLQTMLPVLYSEGVVKQRISLERFVAVTSTNAAKLFGLYPQKGTIAVGSDADLALWDPRAKRKFTNADVLSRSGFSLHDGWVLSGGLKTTIRRGEVVFEDGKVTAVPGSGRPLRCGRTRPIG